MRAIERFPQWGACVSALALGTLSAAAADPTSPTSAYISAAIAAGIPRFEPPAPAGEAGPAAVAGKKPLRTDPGVAALPTYTVMDSKIPTEEQILTFQGRAKIAMDKYLGPSDGLDRGVLNRYTLPQLWKKIPLLGLLPFVGSPVQMSNEDRGFDAGGANDTLPYPHPPPAEKN